MWRDSICLALAIITTVAGQVVDNFGSGIFFLSFLIFLVTIPEEGAGIVLGAAFGAAVLILICCCIGLAINNRVKWRKYGKCVMWG